MSRRHIASSSNNNDATTATKELAKQLFLLQKNADDIFEGLASCTASLDARVTKLSTRVTAATS